MSLNKYFRTNNFVSRCNMIQNNFIRSYELDDKIRYLRYIIMIFHHKHFITFYQKWKRIKTNLLRWRYGRYNTVRQLLDSEKGTFIINESDGEGLTPLHIASKQGHTRVVQLLLNRGALLHRDHNGRNPLHLAAMNSYTQTIELLLSVHSHLLDQTDKDGVRIWLCKTTELIYAKFRTQPCTWPQWKTNRAP